MASGIWEEVRVDIGRLHNGIFEWSNDHPDEMIVVMKDKHIKFVVPIIPFVSIYMQSGIYDANTRTLCWGDHIDDFLPSLVGKLVEVAIMNFDYGWIMLIITNDDDAYQTVTEHTLDEYKMYEGTLGGYNVSS